MNTPIGSSDSYHHPQQTQAYGNYKQAAPAAQSGQPVQQIQNQLITTDDDTVHKHGGHGGGHGKVSEVKSKERSFRSHLSHMKSPQDILKQQRLMRELALKEQAAKAEERRKKTIEASSQMEKKIVKRDDKDKEKQQKKKKQEEE